MLKPRRALLMAAAAGIAGALTRPLGLSALQSPQPMPSPNAPRNENVPAGMDGPEIIKPTKAQPNPVNQMQIAALVHQLYKLTGELKEEVDQTDLNSTFPLSVVKKAHDIEKLAKQIKDRAKG